MGGEVRDCAVVRLQQDPAPIQPFLPLRLAQDAAVVEPQPHPHAVHRARAAQGGRIDVDGDGGGGDGGREFFSAGGHFSEALKPSSPFANERTTTK